ncbi:MAG: porphobilinogen synthase [Deltaproteobacteria bacterium]|nr:porphobilinogen synthase [Deltaproteobacteria bacterium]
MAFPQNRLRRLRASPVLRRMAAETRLSLDDLILPLFIVEGKGVREPIASLPGQFRLSPDKAAQEARSAFDLGLPAVLLFGLPDSKDPEGSGAWAEKGVVQEGVRAIKKAVPEMCVICDTCLCEYTDHGHCGPVRGEIVDNDAALPLLARTAVSQARAGADMVAPSDMMDGRVGAIRRALDESDLSQVPILAYSAKFASAFYGPFREAVQSAPAFGDRKTYQMDPPNVREALRETALDVEEGADLIMVKPALAYLDVIRAVRERFDLPLAAYNVSGEYAMIKAAAQRGWIDGQQVMMETLIAIKRAGADLILTYFAVEAAKLLAGRT